MSLQNKNFISSHLPDYSDNGPLKYIQKPNLHGPLLYTGLKLNKKHGNATKPGFQLSPL
jgi:hypothetical protein